MLPPGKDPADSITKNGVQSSDLGRSPLTNRPPIMIFNSASVETTQTPDPVVEQSELNLPCEVISGLTHCRPTVAVIA